MYCGNGREVEASINEKGTAVGGAPGDQTGREFLIRSYRNFPWNHVLRYRENTATKSITEVAQEVIAGKWGNGSDRMRRLTSAGYNATAVQKKVNELLGAKSGSQAVRNQRGNNPEAECIVDSKCKRDSGWMEDPGAINLITLQTWRITDHKEYRFGSWRYGRALF